MSRQAGKQVPAVQIIYDPESGNVATNHPSDHLLTLWMLGEATKAVADAAAKKRKEAEETKVQIAPGPTLNRLNGSG